MARRDNLFALLVDDDEGDHDVMNLVAKVEAKTLSQPSDKKILQEQLKQKPSSDKFPSKPLPPAESVRGERGRGRGGRGRGPGRGGSGFGGGDSGRGFEGDSDGRGWGRGGSGFGGGDAGRGFEGDSDGRGWGRGRGRGGRGRGRGRGFYEDRPFGNENQDNGGEGVEEGTEGQGKGYGFGENRPFRYENERFGEENRNTGWEGRGYGSENPGFRGGRRRGGLDGTRYVRREGGNGSENKEEAVDVKEQPVNVANNGDGGSGWDMPETTEMPKDEGTEQANPEKVVSEDVPEKKIPEEEDNEMTLDEYEKLLNEKRKALEALKTEERKVVIGKEFEGMQLVEKKKEDDLVIKLKSEKDKLKKKDSLEKEEKVRKSLSINEFLKPAEGEKYVGPASARGRGGRGRGRGERGGFRGGFTGRSATEPDRFAPAPSIEDPGQFPVLGGVAKA